MDESIIDLEDVLVLFGLKERKPWPEPVLAPVSPLRQMISSAMQHTHNEDEHEHTISEPVTTFARVRISSKSGASQKNKMAKQSRKKNRRKKK